ncbi:MAG: hypothetical protein EBU27_00615, partial [Opitutae bacterium]|nr:hypothetical protein [Opitutae bacterium]
MIPNLLKLLSICFLFGGFLWADENGTDTNSSSPSSLSEGEDDIIVAYQIPIRDQIGPPILDILRRGLKDAIREKAELVILDMDTPGGE